MSLSSSLTNGTDQVAKAIHRKRLPYHEEDSLDHFGTPLVALSRFAASAQADASTLRATVEPRPRTSPSL
jgi:hypothetical protein